MVDSIFVHKYSCCLAHIHWWINNFEHFKNFGWKLDLFSGLYMILHDNVSSSINGTLISCTEYYYIDMDVWTANTLTTVLHILEPEAPNYSKLYIIIWLPHTIWFLIILLFFDINCWLLCLCSPIKCCCQYLWILWYQHRSSYSGVDLREWCNIQR